MLVAKKSAGTKLASKKSGAKKSLTPKSGLSDMAKKIAEVDSKINKKCSEVEKLNEEILQLRKEKLELSLYPHKLGDTVISEVQVGKTRKKSECVLEMSDGGILYVRPIKKDGELSGRRFSLVPTGNKTYHDFIEEVKK